MFEFRLLYHERPIDSYTSSLGIKTVRGCVGHDVPQPPNRRRHHDEHSDDYGHLKRTTITSEKRTMEMHLFIS